MKNFINKTNIFLFAVTLIPFLWGCNSHYKTIASNNDQLSSIDAVPPSKQQNKNSDLLSPEIKTKQKSNTSTQYSNPSATIEFAASSNTEIDSIYWFERIHTFGDVPSGPPASTKFYFINKGNKPITISDVQAGCSCTATDYTKGLISPNDTGYVSAAYKTANTFGFFRKHVDVYFDHKDKKHHLILTGNVDPMRSK